VGGRIADWGPLPPLDELAERTERALAGRSRARRAVPPEEVDEIRIVHTWIAAHDPPRLDLDELPDGHELADWVRRATGGAGAGAEPLCLS
jgi:hypothetical protein